MTRGLWASAAALAAVLGLFVPPVAAQQSPPGKTIQIGSTFTEPPSRVDGARCREFTVPPPDCRAVEKTTTTFAGTIAGVADAEAVGSMGADGKYHFDGTWRLRDATVEGCGRGDLVLEMYDGTVAPELANPTRPLVGETRWRVRPGSGSADLARIAGGGGTAEFVFSLADVATEHWVKGEMRGAMTCLPAPTPAPPRHPPLEIKTFEVRAEYTEPPPGPGLRCSGVAAQSPTCQMVFIGPVRFTGTITGLARAATGAPAADGHQYEGPDVFEDAVVAGCGRGGFIIDTFEGSMHPEDVRADGSTGGYNRWRLRPGSGTGGLTGLISGEGENHWRQHWSESATDTWGRGVFTGSITCAVPKQATGPTMVRSASQEVLPETGPSISPMFGTAALLVSLGVRLVLRARRGS